ncbi:MAG: helix-turn-helix domain-containing protein [Planctomycetota bacterium]
MRFPSFTVLVVDLSSSRKKDGALMTYLQEKGFQVKTIRDPKRAEDKIRAGAAQLVFLILGRRKGDNPSQVLQSFHRANSDVPTVVVSPRPTLDQVLGVLRGRAFDYLTSPCRWEDVDDCVQTAIEEKGYFLTMEDRLNYTLGERIRAARTERGLTLRQLSRRTGLSVSLISQIELAKSSPSVATLFKLSRALKVKLNELFSGF